VRPTLAKRQDISNPQVAGSNPAGDATPLPDVQWGQPVNAVDVTPSLFRPPMPRAPAAPPPPQPKVRSNAGVPPEVYARELKPLNSFLDGDWTPDDSPLRPRRRYVW